MTINYFIKIGIKIINIIKKLTVKQKILLIIFMFLFIWFWFILPDKLFNSPYSTVIIDKNNKLLGAHIAKDGQWRFPLSENIPEKFEKSILTFEDKRFYYHFGFDLISISRAFWQNISAGKIVSGGSTISMQLIRLSRKVKQRTIKEKIIETIKSVRLEFAYSKKEILNLYSSHAPFGGNVVGIDAASWRYFGRKASELSWAESAMLAVLPNSPSLIHPGKNRAKLLAKRNRLLKRLYDKKIIGFDVYELAIEEPIPNKPKPFPQIAIHLLNRAAKEDKKNKIIKTTIDYELQEKVTQIAGKYHRIFKGNGIYNIAVLVADVENGNVMSYYGNINDLKDKNHGNQVDVILADRSTGSILKPILYAAMLTSGDILQNSLVPDIPMRIGSYMPQNYNLGYDGAVPARRALARSLNIPAVKLLQRYGVQKLHFLLKKIGLKSINKPPSHYGLSLILGGTEGRLWDLVGIYASMARTLNHYTKYNGMYNKNDYFPLNYRNSKSIKNKAELLEDSWFSAAAIWLTFKAMIDVERPGSENSWRHYSSSQKVAWKTGTSFGFRDAWAIGLTPKYVVGVWVGNADGEGRPGLVGIKTAAPILFDVFNVLPQSNLWFDKPYDEMTYAATCKRSGYLASSVCDEIDSIWIPQSGLKFSVCPYHKLVHLDMNEEYRVTSNCESVTNMVHKPWFILPPSIEKYYKSKNSNYKQLPPFREDCKNSLSNSENNVMDIIYPHLKSKIFVPIEISGTVGSTVFEVAHRNSNAIIYWHIDDKYIGQTKYFHQLSLNPPIGKHTLTLIDENGKKIIRKFEIIGK